MVICVARPHALDRPLECVRKRELSMLEVFVPLESMSLGVAMMPELRRAAMVIDVHAIVL